MPFVSVPKDLTKVKTKVALNLTKRQLICFGSAALTGVPVFFLTRVPLGNQVSVLLMIVVMLPFFFTAMYEKDGMPAEKIAKNYLRAKIWPARRVYKTQNLYDYIEKEGKAFERQQQNTTAYEAKTRHGAK
jgi:hypothetical protein